MGKSMKQSAVEFLFREMERMQYFIGNDLYHAYEEAKEMEEEQMQDIYKKGIESATCAYHGKTPKHSSFEEYYNETYKSK